MTTYYSRDIRWSMSIEEVRAIMRKAVTPPFRWTLNYDQYVKAEMALGYRGRMPWRMAMEVRKTGVDPKE